MDFLPKGWRRAVPPIKNASQASIADASSFLRAITGGLDEHTLTGVSTVYSCVRVIADALAQLPMKLYKWTQDGNREEIDPGHYAMNALRFPSPEFTNYDLRRTIAANATLHGEAFIVMNKNELGRAVELIPVPTPCVERRRENGELVFYVTSGGIRTKIPFDKMIHIKQGLSFDALSVTAQSAGVANCIKVAQSIDAQMLAFYKNGANPGIIIETAHPLSADQITKLQEQFIMRADAIGSLRPMILGRDMKVNTVQLSGQASQTAEQRKEQDLAICRVFGVPPSKIGIQQGAYNNPEHQSLDFVTNTLGTICTNWEQVFAGTLLNGPDKFLLYFRHNFDSLLKADLQTRYAAHAIGRQNGWLSVNDIRKKEDLPPIENGDSYLEPMNMKEAGSGATGNPGTQTTRQKAMNERIVFNSGYMASIEPLMPTKTKELKAPVAAIKARWAEARKIEAKAEPNEFLVYGSIGEDWWEEGITAKAVRKFLDTQSGEVTIRINSPGGDVFEGNAIYNALKEFPGKVTVYIDALAASAATVIMMAADEIKIAENATIMVHKAWTIAAGNSDDFLKEAEILDKIDEALVSTYSRRTGRGAEEIKDILAKETWMTAQEAVDGKFADAIVEGKKAPEPKHKEEDEKQAELQKRFAAIQDRIKAKATA